MGDDDQRSRQTGPQFEQRAVDRVAGSLIQRRRRFVKEQDNRLQRQRSRWHHALLLADRQSPRGSLGERAVEAGEPERPLDVTVVTAEPRTVAHVLANRARQQRRQLRHETNLATQREHVIVANVSAPIPHGPRMRIGEPVQQSQQRRLTGAGGADQRSCPLAELEG